MLMAVLIVGVYAWRMRGRVQEMEAGAAYAHPVAPPVQGPTEQVTLYVAYDEPGVLRAPVPSSQFSAISNYTVIHQQAGITVERFAKDMRGVSNVASFTSSYLKVWIPTNFTSRGTVSGTNVVTWSYSNHALYRTESITGLTDMQATNVSSLTFSLYDKSGNTATNLSSAKGVQVDIGFRNDVQSQAVSEDSLSARLDMRNTL